jgi:hypothetical protein
MSRANGKANREIDEILSAIVIASPQEFVFGGRNFPLQQAHAPGVPANPTAEAQTLIGGLANLLYEFAYSRHFTGQLPEPPMRDFTPDATLLEALSSANTTRERWEQGWTIGRVLQHGQILAQKGNASRTLWPGQFISKDGPAMMPRVGAEISIFYAREARSLQTGFYYAFGEAVEDEMRGYGLVRLYWNVSFEGAPKLINAMTSRLNRFQVPFRMKFATARSQFDRTDVAVVYLAKRFFRIATELMVDVHPLVAGFLEEEVPLFTKKLAAGLGVAEDPGTSESFGQSRCRCLAESVWNCYQRGDQSPQSRRKEFQRLSQQKGIHPEMAHLNAGSMDWYELPQVL